MPVKERGPRGEGWRGMTRAQIDHHSNLIVLCKSDHKEVDDHPERFPIEDLRRRKQEHRAWIDSLGGDERQPGGQAEKIAAWPSVVRSDPAVPDSSPAWGAEIHNGSELPVYQVHVEFVPIERGRGMNVIVIELIPPGDWLVSGRKVYPKPEGGRAPLSQQDAWRLPDRTYVIELRFTDVDGRTWRRSKDGVLAAVSADAG